MKNEKPKISVKLSFEEVSLPPFKDILILSKKCPHGTIGISKCMNFLLPDGFDLVEIEHDIVEAMIINKRILKKINLNQILRLINEKILPYINTAELVKVDLNITLSYESIEIPNS